MPTSIGVVDTFALKYNQTGSPIHVINGIPGASMEERSPGSYRLSIRGSLLRSPFGIRNLKVYVNEFSLTDAGGNTYLNLLDFNAINKIEVYKGPDGSTYGANSGGIVKIRISDTSNLENGLKSTAMIGSYGLVNQNTHIGFSLDKHQISIFQGNSFLEGYRENSNFQRNFYLVNDFWKYSPKGQMQVMILYSRLSYGTPGGLTLQQWHDNPRSARLATSTFPGASEQQAGVKNRTLYGGLHNQFRINQYLTQSTAIFGSLTLFVNRFITNYEERDEKNIGIRSLFTLSNRNEGKIHINYDLGIESQFSKALVGNFGNRYGIKDTIQAIDDMIAVQSFIFTKLTVDFFNRLILESSASLNYNSLFFRGIAPEIKSVQKKNYKPSLMPRFVLSYMMSYNLALRLTISKGFSPPSFNEIRSSNNIINTNLEPESGINYETGLRLYTKSGSWFDVALFYYLMDNAIVRQLGNNGAEFFLNSGIIIQQGLEIMHTQKILNNSQGTFFSSVTLNNSITAYAFKFKEYKVGQYDYSNNSLTGVPDFRATTNVHAIVKQKSSIYIRYNYITSIPLNDANSVYSSASHLVFIRVDHQFLFGRNNKLTLFIGIDNLLNQKYSLGYDINAFGDRYHNPAPKRNYLLGINLKLASLL